METRVQWGTLMDSLPWWGACAGRILKDLLMYPLAREGVYGPGVHAFLAHTKQKVSNIVGLTASIFYGI